MRSLRAALALLIVALGLAWPLSAQAHSPHLSYWRFERIDSQHYLVRAQFPQATAARALAEKLGPEALKTLERAEFEKQLGTYFEETIKLTSDGKPVRLTLQELQMSSHASEVSLRFPLDAAAEDGLQVELLSFTEGGHHNHTVLWKLSQLELTPESGFRIARQGEDWILLKAPSKDSASALPGSTPRGARSWVLLAVAVLVTGAVAVPVFFELRS